MAAERGLHAPRHPRHLEEWKRKSDNVYAWAADHLVPDPSAKVLSNDLFRVV